MSTLKRPLILRLEEARSILKHPPSTDELAQRREALQSSDRFIREMKPVEENVKEWIREERGDETGG
jgi:hypothetical protein